MAECLKLLNDLNSLSNSMSVSTLKHFFATYDPSTSKPLRETISHFHMRDIEAADYRSAYHQFCDWLYGWNVSDASDFVDLRGSIADYLKLKRMPRDMDLQHDREKSECLRLMKTFETLFSLSRRQLKKFYMEIEEEMPRLGQGLDTLTEKKKSGTPKKGEDDLLQELDDDVEKVWANAAPVPDDGNKELLTLDEPQEMEQNTLLEEDNDSVDSDDDESEDNQDGKVRGSVIVRRRSHVLIARALVDQENDLNAINEELDPDQPLDSEVPPQEIQENEQENEEEEEYVEPEEENGIHVRSSILPQTEQDHEEPMDEQFLMGGGNVDGAFQFMAPTTVGAFQSATDTVDEAMRALQRDVNHVMAEVDRIVEYTLVAQSSLLAVLTFCELVDDKENFAKYSMFAHELSMDFVSNTLKTVWDLLNREVPAKMSLETLRNPSSLKDVIKHLLQLRTVNGFVPKFRMRKLHFKFQTIHDIFTAFDVHLLPNFINAHKEGVKCAQSSAFDSNLWLTGGYDCIIRISDIRAANQHICLAQYVGHKSIITDVHFTKNDSQIVSSSFDRTIKIWNSQQATAEKTLVGHADAVTSCDVTPDARYIASGSTDSTVRFWDYNTGECITVIRKHTRWIKCVRFSPDGRYLATAGLDRRVYIWETKILANSRSPSHSRGFDSFGDYVLEMAMYKPSLLLTTARDSTIRLFDYMTGHELQSISLAPSWACSVAFSANGEFFATGSFDNNVNIFRTRDFVKMREIRVFNLGIMCVRFPKDLSYVAVGSTEGFLQQIPL